MEKGQLSRNKAGKIIRNVTPTDSAQRQKRIRLCGRTEYWLCPCREPRTQKKARKKVILAGMGTISWAAAMVPIALGGESRKCSFHVRSVDSAVWHDKRDGKSTETSGPCQNVASRLQTSEKKRNKKTFMK